MGTIPASPLDPSGPGDAIATNIPCGNCRDGVLLIRNDGYVYCPTCDPAHPPLRVDPKRAADAGSGAEAAGVADADAASATSAADAASATSATDAAGVADADAAGTPGVADAASATSGADAADAADAGDAPVVAAAVRRSRYPERIEHSDLLVPKAELGGAMSDADRAAHDADYDEYQQRYRDALRPATPARPRRSARAPRRPTARHGD